MRVATYVDCRDSRNALFEEALRDHTIVVTQCFTYECCVTSQRLWKKG